MAITATFRSDFTDFHAGVAEAEKKLDKLSVTSERTSTALVKMTGSTTTLSSSMRQFDGVLSSVGVNLSPQIRGIEDLAAASGKTATELGGFATAGLAAGVAMAGWQTGRAIAEFFKLDEAIGKATATLLGWGDVAAQTAGAKMDVINKAIANGADAMISYTDAIKFNQKAHEDWKAPLDAAAKLAAFEASLKQTAFEAEHLTMAQQTIVTSALAVGKTHAEIATALGLSTDAIDLYVKGLQATEKAEKIAAADAAKLAAEIPPVAKAMIEADAAGKVWNTGMVITTGVIEDMVVALTAAEAWTKKFADAQAEWKTTKADHAKGFSFGVNEANVMDVAKGIGLGGYNEQAQLRQLLAEGYAAGDALDILQGESKDNFTPKAPAAMAGGLGGSPTLGGGGLTSLTGRGGPAAVIQNTFHIVDTEANIIQRVSAGITRSLLQGTKLGFR